MSLLFAIDTPFFDANGAPLAFGTVYFGQPNQDAVSNPKVPYTDDTYGTPLSATQELTIGGKFAQEVWLDGDYSIIIKDADDVQVAEYLLVPEPEGGGGGGIESVVAGDAIDVDAADPANPIVSFNGGIADVTGLQTALDAKQDIRNTVTAVTSSSGVVTINYALGDYFTLALSENVTSWSFTNLPGSGKGASIMIRITQDSTARTVAWPASFAFTYGSEESVPVGSGDVALLAISTLDNGTKWFATMASEA